MRTDEIYYERLSWPKIREAAQADKVVIVPSVRWT